MVDDLVRSIGIEQRVIFAATDIQELMRRG
jgi:hypothetical protein